jgi:D-lactate dehydrogenase (cytochrome)
MEKEGIAAVSSGYDGYLYDESRLNGYADYIAFPENTEQALAALCYAADEGLALTIQGARTGIAGGAVPQGGLILSTERMNRPLGFSARELYLLQVQSGMSFDGIANLLRERLPPEDWDTESKVCFRKVRQEGRNLRFPPNPTESTASLGGAFACNARGPNALRWGNVGTQVQSLRWISPAGELWDMERGRYRFDESGCPLPGGRRLSCTTGLAAGGSLLLHPYQGLDLIDFLAGSEGLLGFAAELSLYLRKLPGAVWGVIYFFEEDQAALNFAEALRYWREQSAAGEALSTLEYYDDSSLELVRTAALQSSVLRQLPVINPQVKAAIHVELEDEQDDTLEAIVLEQLALFLEAGGKEEHTWAAASPAELEKFHLLRHAVPELINKELDTIRQVLPSLPKIAADFQVPPAFAAAYRKRYRRDMEAEGLRGFVFGHIGEGRFHVNLLPEDNAALCRSRALLDHWAASVIQDGGLLAAENGIGRLKRNLIRRHLPPERLEQIRSILSAFDRKNMLGGFEADGDEDYADWRLC